MKKLILVLVTLLLLFSCDFTNKGDEVIYMEYDGSYLPIYSRGNHNSDITIIWTHGGPGSSAMYYGDIPEIEPLHNKYQIVYWDQMSSGGSMGKPNSEDFTLETFSDQLEGVVKVVKKRFPSTKLYILGHSWGGFLVSYYLADKPERQDNFDGVVLLNPILDIHRSLTESIAYVDSFAKEKISEGKDIEYWQDALNWYKENLTESGILVGANIAIHYEYIEKTGGMLKKLDRNNELTVQLGLKMMLFSPFHFYNYYLNQSNIRTYLQIENATLKNDGVQSQKLENITLPLQFIAGIDDKIATIEQSRDWYSQLGGTNNPDLVELNDCAHAAFLDQPDQFIATIESFVK